MLPLCRWIFGWNIWSGVHTVPVDNNFTYWAMEKAPNSRRICNRSVGIWGLTANHRNVMHEISGNILIKSKYTGNSFMAEYHLWWHNRTPTTRARDVIRRTENKDVLRICVVSSFPQNAFGGLIMSVDLYYFHLDSLFSSVIFMNSSPHS